MSIGIRAQRYKATQTDIVSSTGLEDVDLSVPIKANQRIHARWFVPVTTGAVGGAAVFISEPAGSTVTIRTAIFNLPNGTQKSYIYPGAPSAMTDPLAAGNSFIIAEAVIVNGPTAGVIGFNMGQETADADALEVLVGGFVEYTIF